MTKVPHFDNQIEWMIELEEYVYKLLKDYKEEFEKIAKSIDENFMSHVKDPKNRFFISFFISKIVGEYFTNFLLGDFIKLEEIKLREALEDDYDEIKAKEEEDDEKIIN
ncbi:hypothetical protein F1847_03665 [Thermodesulfobacterium sp. TA1]|uniref:hypothetical protein n=1 Tax=Thermodesulfobacterium sp. TA1 TaxID=2234087 RepID=UPI001232DC39|nr:hypothetical protein [Thermodesulfobacterium sp. TA1]QER41887.1 hypothetical protein F1847_03665 [Thermodesulfobacterium sp. TA1]